MTKDIDYWVKWWDENNPTGEGFTNLGIEYQWVRVEDNQGKVLGTFMFRISDGELESMFLAPARPHLPPNPYVFFLVGEVFTWYAVDPIDGKRSTPHVKPRSAATRGEVEAEFNKRLDALLDERRFQYETWGEVPSYFERKLKHRLQYLHLEVEQWGRGDDRIVDPVHVAPANANGGVSEALRRGKIRPITGIVPVPRSNNDHGIKFKAGNDGFEVRLSKLAPLLWKFRQAGVQHVSLRLLKGALQRS